MDLPRRGRHVAFLLIAIAAASASSRAQVVKLLEVDGTGAGDLFGRVAYVGDVDGDGFDDFAVGALRNDNVNGVDAGAAYLYSGRTGALIKTWLGDAGNRTFGDRVARVGDLNGDGFEEIAISATSWNLNGPPQYVRVYNGRFLRDGSPPEVLFDFAPTQVGDVGLHIDKAGDVDGDGTPDFLVGCGFGERDAFVVSGKNGATLYDAVIAGKSDLGVTVAGIGDVDGDGFADFLVGSYRETVNGAAEEGQVWLYSGGPPGTIGTVIDSVHGDNSLDWFGIALLRLPDIDGDGTADFVVGATGQPDSATSIAGYARVFSGATRQIITEYVGDNPGDFFGIELAAGDLNGDSYPDVIVTARHEDNGSHKNNGAVTAFSGFDGSQMFQFKGHHAGDKLGRADASGDLDGDGLADLLVGTGHVTVNGMNDAGAAFVFPGNAQLASATSYGTGFAGALGIPKLESDVEPALGTSINLTIGNSAGVSTFGLLLLGPSSALIPTNRGGDLLVAASALLPVIFPSAADATLPEDVPYDTPLNGMHVYLQALEIDAGAAKGISFSAGLDLALGGVAW